MASKPIKPYYKLWVTFEIERLDPDNDHYENVEGIIIDLGDYDTVEEAQKDFEKARLLADNKPVEFMRRITK